MDPLGLQTAIRRLNPEKQAYIFMELPTEIVPLWQLGVQEPSKNKDLNQKPSSPHRMEPHGLQGLLAQQMLSMESPPADAHSPCLLRKVFPLRDNTEKLV